MSDKPKQLKLIDTLPKVKSYFGGDVKLTHDDLIAIEDLVAIGAGLEMVACELNLDLADFKRVGKVSRLIQTAVKRGRAKDRWEYEQALRNKSIEMSSPILSIWHGKQAYGMTDKATHSQQGASVVVVQTNVPQPITITEHIDKPVIDHE